LHRIFYDEQVGEWDDDAGNCDHLKKEKPFRTKINSVSVIEGSRIPQNEKVLQLESFWGRRGVNR
jgi:hypothetical protein